MAKSIKKLQNSSDSNDEFLGKIFVGNKCQLIGVLGNTAITLSGETSKTQKLPSKTTCLVDVAAPKNLPLVVNISRYLVHLKGNLVLAN